MSHPFILVKYLIISSLKDGKLHAKINRIIGILTIMMKCYKNKLALPCHLGHERSYSAKTVSDH